MPLAPIIPKASSYAEPPPVADYAAARSSFDWQAVADDLSIDPAAMNLGELATAAQVAHGRGDSIALSWYGADGSSERLSYKQLEDSTARAAAAFQKAGVQRGDRILFLLPNMPALYTGFLGALRAGAIAGILGGIRNIDALRNILLRCRPRVLVTLPTFRAPLVSLREEIKELQQVLFVSRPSMPPPMIGEREGSWSGVLEAAAPAFGKPATNSADRAFLQYSDLGMAGAACAHRVALPLITTSRDVLEIRPGESVLTVAMPGEPVFLSYSLLAPFLVGATVIAIEDPARFQKFNEIQSVEKPRVWVSSHKALDVILRTDPNLGLLLGTCRNITVTHPYDPAFIQMTSVSFGSPVHACWWDREFGVIQTAEMRGNDIKPGSVGRPVPGTEIRIVDEDNAPVAAGVSGSVSVKVGPGAPFVEYWDDAGLTGTHVRDGWFVTTHHGRIDADGWLWIEG